MNRRLKAGYHRVPKGSLTQDGDRVIHANGCVGLPLPVDKLGLKVGAAGFAGIARKTKIDA